MRTHVALALCLIRCVSLAQIEVFSDSAKLSNLSKISFLDRGYLDFFSGASLNGQAQATIRIVRIWLGERDPKAVRVPLVFLVGVSGNGIGSNDPRQLSYASMLNTLGGLLNFAVTDNAALTLFQNKGAGEITGLALGYHLGARMITASDSASSQVTSWSGYAGLGLYFQTPAWQGDEKGPDFSKTKGIFWTQIKTFWIAAGQYQLDRVFGTGVMKNNLFGYSIDVALQIEGVINLKFGLSKATNISTEGYKSPVLRFSLDFQTK